MKREFTVIVEKGDDGYYFAQVPELDACQTQAKSLDKLMDRIREAIELCLEEEADSGLRKGKKSAKGSRSQFVGVQRVMVET
ncbi:MAG TPA: type II toxin-antitoxin system HicB family antitoxin [Phycisphaerae bacterium]|nr:type II toxin-antitoxin system HicB family antitoxin [Phycisphaerae bacterium]